LQLIRKGCNDAAAEEAIDDTIDDAVRVTRIRLLVGDTDRERGFRNPMAVARWQSGSGSR